MPLFSKARDSCPGLALAGANRRGFAGPEQEDGIDTAEEVAS